tara:strand:- start:2650 stop:3531 length:882 start_codon:yes stop_codon:yes gene_type:complete
VNSVTKIMVFNNFGDNREDWIKRLSKQSPSGRRWNKIELTSEISQADYIIILDGAGNIHKNDFNLFKEKPKIFLQREPEQVQGKIRVNKNKFVKYVDYDTKCPYVDWWLDYDYNYLANLKYQDLNKRKQNPICIVTGKGFTDGHRKRLSFLIKNQYKTEIDFYGKRDISKMFTNYVGVPEYYNTSKRDKSRIFEYDVSISMENGSRKNFFTRVAEDLLCWALPIYWGCPNLQDFLPKGSYRYIDIDKDYTKQELTHLLRKPEEKEIKAIAEAREIILNEYNFFPYVEKILETL